MAAPLLSRYLRFLLIVVYFAYPYGLQRGRLRLYFGARNIFSMPRGTTHPLLHAATIDSKSEVSSKSSMIEEEAQLKSLVESVQVGTPAIDDDIGNEPADDGTNQGLNGRRHTDLSKAKISAANKGKTPWNVGKKHSEETRLRIAAKTKEAMIRKKTKEANDRGMTLEEFEAAKKKEKVEKHKMKRKGGLTVEGRQRISESLKKRWTDPEYRAKYSENSRGNRNHTSDTKARIAMAIREKWKNDEYRQRVTRPPSPEVRARISATLKARWEDPEFRDKMLNNNFHRTPEWRALVSQKIRDKWNDPVYRQAVEEGIKNSNRTFSFTSVRSRSTRRRLSPAEILERKERARQLKLEKTIARKEAMRAAKQAMKENAMKGRSLKQLLGGEIWFEEKMKRTKRGELMLDDASLELELTREWTKTKKSEGVAQDEEEDEDEEEEEEEEEEDVDDFYNDHMLYDDDDDEDDLDDEDEGDDLIEVYDDSGELIGTYTEAEFQQLRGRK